MKDRSQSLLRIVRVAIALLLFVPVAAGAVWAQVQGNDLSAAWTKPDAEEIKGAPVPLQPTGIDPAQLVGARRALGEASAQAGFTKAGTKELDEGAQKLLDGMNELTNGAGQAVAGSAQLRDGLVKLQNATGELGRGATQVADGVQVAVDQINQIPVLRDQILAALDEIDQELALSIDPNAAEARIHLVQLRVAVVNFQVPPPVSDQLNQLKTGSREVADQIAKPGKPYHEGVFAAAKGGKDLAAGLAKLNDGALQLRDGTAQLKEGTAKVDGLAQSTVQKIGTVQRSIPQVAELPKQTANTDASSAQDQDEVAEAQQALAPMYAFVIAALVMLAAASIWLVARPWTWPKMSRFIVTPALVSAVGIAATGVMLLLILGIGLDATAIAAGSIVIVLAVMAASLLARATIAVCGPTFGRLAVLVGIIFQTGITGWVWKVASTATIKPSWQVLVHLMPVHYATEALTAIGNGGSLPPLWAATGVLGLTIVFSALIAGLVPDAGAVAGRGFDEEEGYGINRAPRERAAHGQPLAVAVATATQPLVADSPAPVPLQTDDVVDTPGELPPEEKTFDSE